jgi:hypothetical protein
MDLDATGEATIRSSPEACRSSAAPAGGRHRHWARAPVTAPRAGAGALDADAARGSSLRFSWA